MSVTLNGEAGRAGSSLDGSLASSSRDESGWETLSSGTVTLSHSGLHSGSPPPEIKSSDADVQTHSGTVYFRPDCPYAASSLKAVPAAARKAAVQRDPYNFVCLGKMVAEGT
ncbi:hypothetical protein RvY_00917 [Ramazzottius varieornatus]|uniref:Uncharacterized protein n=1 Tax=Ramazzottius varieornatus TaxID=947166 RepID=A0A1D1UFD5_RAMVA|nr:hypothetical protein RvY_00917 [Ramazzottius varieornatus]